MLEGWQRRKETEMEMIAWHAAIIINLFSKQPVTVDQLLGRNRPMTFEEKHQQFEELMKIMAERRGNEWKL